jgi:3-phenylpropionate/cinnamic acid dioxygenase small subunit
VEIKLMATIETASRSPVAYDEWQPGDQLPFNSDGFAKAYAFYTFEADLLDNWKFAEWLKLLDKELEYKVPVRVTSHKSKDPGFSKVVNHIEDDHPAMVFRIRRLVETGLSWAEEPPSRIRRFVTNLSVGRVADDLLAVKSSLLITRNRTFETGFELFSGVRLDRLRDSEGGLRLLSRTVLGDQATLGNNNLGFIF